MENKITPTTIKKEIRELISNQDTKESSKKQIKEDINMTIEMLEEEMHLSAKNLDFERAMELRDIIFELKCENK